MDDSDGADDAEDSSESDDVVAPSERPREPWPVDDEGEPIRPVTRGDCENKRRPCPWASCKWHLIHERPNIDDVEQLKESCVLDVADWGGAGPLTVGRLLGHTKQAIQQLEDKVRTRRGARFRIIMR